LRLRQHIYGKIDGIETTTGGHQYGSGMDPHHGILIMDTLHGGKSLNK